MRGFGQSANNAGAVDECEIYPPPEKVKRYGHQRDEHGVFHQGVHMVFISRCADLVHTEAYVDQKHQNHGKPVIKLGKYDD
jgi:hypothetical protein